MQRLTVLLTVAAIIAAVYFFSFQLQKFFSYITGKISRSVGTFAADKEYSIQRYVYLHQSSKIAKFYNWLNEQLIASGMKRLGVTPIGYVIFWGFVAAVSTLVLSFVLNFNAGVTILMFVVLFIIFMVLTRVWVSGRLERREAEVMDAMDLIIPEIGQGVKNAIARYVDNFAPSIQQDFKIFLSNIQDRGMPFEDAMLVLADSLGHIFKDFAQKAIFFEALGEEDMKGIFDDIVETNRQRRELRYQNGIVFTSLRTNFIISSVFAIGYFIFIMATDSFSRYFFLQTNLGTILLIAIALTIFGVLSYIATIKSRNL